MDYNYTHVMEYNLQPEKLDPGLFVEATEKDFQVGAIIWELRKLFNPWTTGTNHLLYPVKIEKSDEPRTWNSVALTRTTTWPNHLPCNPKGTKRKIYRGNIKKGVFYKEREGFERLYHEYRNRIPELFNIERIRKCLLALEVSRRKSNKRLKYSALEEISKKVSGGGIDPGDLKLMERYQLVSHGGVYKPDGELSHRYIYLTRFGEWVLDNKIKPDNRELKTLASCMEELYLSK